MHIRESIALAAAFLVVSLTPISYAHAIVPGAQPVQNPSLANNILDGIGICDEYLDDTDPRYVDCLLAVYGANCATAIERERFECKALNATIIAIAIQHGIKGLLGDKIEQ